MRKMVARATGQENGFSIAVALERLQDFSEVLIVCTPETQLVAAQFCLALAGRGRVIALSQLSTLEVQYSVFERCKNCLRDCSMRSDWSDKEEKDRMERLTFRAVVNHHYPKNQGWEHCEYLNTLGFTESRKSVKQKPLSNSVSSPAW